MATASSIEGGHGEVGTPISATGSPAGTLGTGGGEGAVGEKLTQVKSARCPPRSASASSLRSAASAGRPLPPGLPAGAVRVGRAAPAASMSTAGGSREVPAQQVPARGSRPGSASSASVAASGGQAERVSSYPLPDLGVSGESSSGSEGTTPTAAGSGSNAPTASPLASAVGGSRRMAGLQTAAAEAAAHAVHDALPGGQGGASAADLAVKPVSAAELAPAGSAELDRDDSFDITRHTKHEKR